MFKFFKQVISVLLLVGFGALPVLAQDGEAAGVATFVGSYTLWIAIIIGFAASIATLVYAYRLKGGIVGMALNLFGAGMFFVVLGFLAVVVAWASEPTQMVVHDFAFIIGYVLMLLGALRLRQIS